MEDKYERMLGEIRKQFIPTEFSLEQVGVVMKACSYIFNHIHLLIDLLEWSIENNSLVCDAPFMGAFLIQYSYEDNRFEVFWEGNFIGYKNTMSAAKLVANDFYKSHICNSLGLFPKKEQFKYELIYVTSINYRGYRANGSYHNNLRALA